MNSMLHLLMGAPAAGAEGAPAGPMAGVMNFLPFVAIIAIFYFLIIRPQNKKQKETKKMLEALKKGDKIVTIGGIHGTIHSVKESTVIIKVDETTKMEFSRTAISGVTSVAAAKEEKSDNDEKTESAAENGDNADK